MPTVLFVGGPRDGERREMYEVRDSIVVDVWTPEDFEVRLPDADVVIPVKLFRYIVHTMAGSGRDRYYVYSPAEWTVSQVMAALMAGYKK